MSGNAPDRSLLPGFKALGAIFSLCLLLAGCSVTGGDEDDDGDPPPATYSVGGTISGLTGTVVLQNNGGNDLSRSENGSFVFSTRLGNDSGYEVSVLTQPEGQICTVSNGSGTVSGANVTGITVTCAVPTFTIGGTISGLSGTIVLRNNGGNSLSLSENGAFAFTNGLVDDSAYAVTVLTQPAGQTCVVANGTGEVDGADVTNVAVTCTTDPVFGISGTISGLDGAVVLQNNNGGDLALSTNGGFSFGFFPVGSPYAVTVLTQPVGQTCEVANGAGTVGSADIANVAVACTYNPHTIGGTVTGLSGGNIVLQNNSGDNLAVPANGAFVFETPVLHGNSYAVTILVEPATQTCVVANGTGTVNAANVSNITVTCTTDTYGVGGTISGLTGTVVLRNNGGDSLSLSADGGFEFGTEIADGSSYNVTVFSQPARQTCTVTNGSGTVSGANVTSVSIECVSFYVVGGSIAGLSPNGTVVLQNNGGGDLSLSANGSFAFAATLLNGDSYEVTILAKPEEQTCEVTNGEGTIDGADVTGVSVICEDIPTFTIGVTVSGLISAIVLQNNGGDNLIVGSEGDFAFATALREGSAYAVTVLLQPDGQVCTVSEGSGTVGTANITGIDVTCVDAYFVGGTVSGLAGTLALRNNGGDDLSVFVDGDFIFSAAVADGSTYAVTILTQPEGQECTVSGGSGTISGVDVTDVSVDCVFRPLALAVTLNPGDLRPEEAFLAHIHIANRSLSAVDDIVLTATVPPDVDGIADGLLTGGGSCPAPCGPASLATWNIGSIAAGEGILVSMPMRVANGTADGTVISLPVEVLIDGAQSSTTSASVTVRTDSVLSLALHEDKDAVAPAAPLTYTLTYGNRGAESITDTTLRLPLPPGLIFVSASGGGTLDGDMVVWDLGALAANDANIQQVEVAVSSGLSDATILVIDAAELSGSSTTGPELARASAATRVSGSSPITLSVVTSLDPDAETQTFITSLSLANVGGADLSGVVLQARFPTDHVDDTANESLSDGGSCPDICSASVLATWNLGTLAAGADVTVQMPVTVTSGTAAGTLITVDAVASSSAGDQAAASDTVMVGEENP